MEIKLSEVQLSEDACFEWWALEDSMSFCHAEKLAAGTLRHRALVRPDGGLDLSVEFPEGQFIFVHTVHVPADHWRRTYADA